MKIFNTIQATVFFILGFFSFMGAFVNPAHIFTCVACFLFACLAICDDTQGESIWQELKRKIQ